MDTLNNSLSDLIERDKGLRRARDLARQEDPEPDHCFQVTRLAHELFHATRTCHGVPEVELRLLIAAALLHDTGYGIRPESHHKGSRDFILSANLPGFKGDERKIVACIARYHRGGPPKSDQKAYRDLKPKDQARVRKLAAVLRIGDGLDRGHDAATTGIEMTRDGEDVCLRITQRFASEIDISGATRKCDYFEREFGVTVRFEVHIVPDTPQEDHH